MIRQLQMPFHTSENWMKTHVLVSFLEVKRRFWSFWLGQFALKASKNETETDQITQNAQKLMIIKHLYTYTDAVLHSSFSFYAQVCWFQIGPLIETISAFWFCFFTLNKSNIVSDRDGEAVCWRSACQTAPGRCKKVVYLGLDARLKWTINVAHSKDYRRNVK